MKSRALALVSVLAVIAAACSSTPAASPATSAAVIGRRIERRNVGASSAATSAPSVAASSAGANTVVLARPASRGINHLAESNVEGAQNADLVYESLVQIDGNGKIIPELATSWEPSADFKTWTFELRPGVKFHDGTPFNAEAVKFNYDRILRVPGQSGGAWTDYADANTVEIVDEDTVVFHLTKPFPG